MIKDEWILVIVVLALCGVIIFLANKSTYEHGYKQGQIDAIKGVIKYEIKKEEVWVPIKEEENND